MRIPHGRAYAEGGESLIMYLIGPRNVRVVEKLSPIVK
jgi:hypothetical protein